MSNAESVIERHRPYMKYLGLVPYRSRMTYAFSSVLDGSALRCVFLPVDLAQPVPLQTACLTLSAIGYARKTPLRDQLRDHRFVCRPRRRNGPTFAHFYWISASVTTKGGV